MKYTLSALLVILLASCMDTEVPDYQAQNEETIEAYIASHDLDAQKTTSGLYYVIDEEGSGLQPTATSNVTVVYKGYFTDDTVFDESDEMGYSTNLQYVIEGWTEGIPYFKEGGSGMLLVPAHLGYGNYDYYDIPAGSVLIFDITLLSVDD